MNPSAICLIALVAVAAARGGYGGDRCEAMLRKCKMSRSHGGGGIGNILSNFKLGSLLGGKGGHSGGHGGMTPECKMFKKHCGGHPHKGKTTTEYYSSTTSDYTTTPYYSTTSAGYNTASSSTYESTSPYTSSSTYYSTTSPYTTTYEAPIIVNPGYGGKGGHKKMGGKTHRRGGRMGGGHKSGGHKGGKSGGIGGLLGGIMGGSSGLFGKGMMNQYL